MGEMSRILPQGPNRHCGLLTPHDKHANPKPKDVATWCDGVRPLEPFYELTIRLPLEKLHGLLPDLDHQEALNYIQEHSLRIILDDIASGAVVLRVRAGGEDKVYPLVAGRNGGFSLVLDAPPPFGDVAS